MSAIQTYLNTPKVEQGRFLWMQTDLEAGASVSQWTFTGTLGLKNLSKSAPGEPSLLSRRHYLMYQPREELRLRAGRFLVAYGLNIPDHYVVTRRGLGFDQEMETYNVEGSWIGERWDAFVTGFFSRPDIPSALQEKGIALRSSLAIGGTSRLGMSYLYGTTDNSRRHLFGPYAIIGLSPRFFSLAEIAFQRSFPKARSPAWGVASYLKLDYQVAQGLQIYASQELSQLDLSNGTTALTGYGLGIQFFPRPHFELQAFYGKRRSVFLGNAFADDAWLLMHYYL